MRANIRNRHDASHYHTYSATRMGPWDTLFIERALAVCPAPARADDGPDALLIVDVGTGSGVIPARLAALPRFARCRFIGYEYFPDMVEEGHRRIVAEGLEARVSIEQGDAHALPLGDGTVDLLLSRATIHHLAEPERALRETFRVLRPGGVALIHDARRDAPAAVLDGFNRLRAEVGYKPTTLEEKYTPGEMAVIVERAGLAAHAALHADSEGPGALGFEVVIRKPAP